MRKPPRHTGPILTPAAVLALVAVAPLMLAGEAAYKACPTGATVAVSTADQAETFVRCVSRAAHEFFKPFIAATAEGVAGFVDGLQPHLFTLDQTQATPRRGFDLPLSLTDLPPPL